MHELSLARRIVTLVEQFVPLEQLSQVRRVHVAIGRMAGVLADSLAFSFDTLVANTPLHRARLAPSEVPLRLACADCRDTLESAADDFCCPACGGSRTTVVTGMELQVVRVELDDSPEEAA